MKYITLVAVLGLSSCAALPLDDGGTRVRVTSNTPQNCEYIGQVRGSCRDQGKTGALYWDESSMEVAGRNAIKNATARMGGDTIEIMSGGYCDKEGEAYKCGRTPASR